MPIAINSEQKSIINTLSSDSPTPRPTEINIIDLSLAKDPATKPKLLEHLRDALFKIGFLYIINHGVEDIARRLQEFSPKAFTIPQEEKEKINMVNSPHFLGYTQVGSETTAKNVDIREQYDFGNWKKDSDWDPSQSQWKRLTGPSLYPPDDVLPGFKSIVEEYLDAMDELSDRFLVLVAECLNLPSKSIGEFSGEINRLKLIRYPPVNNNNNKVLHSGQASQGVGPHKDSSGLFTFVLQDDVGGLEALDCNGSWIPVKPIKDSFAVNIAQGFEALTGGRCGATTHQVVSPESNESRYSIAYFNSVRLDLTHEDIRTQLKYIVDKIPDPVDTKKRQVDVGSEFIQPQYACLGEAHLRNRVVSHKDVSRIWYPELYQKYVSSVEN